MKTENEIEEEIRTLEAYRDSFVVDTNEWHMFKYAIREMKWVIEE